MGGGTGTGGAPVIARAAREHGVLTVGVVTKPFHFEGQRRMRIAESGIQELQQFVDTLIIIPNQNLFRVANEKTTFADAFNMADEVLHSGVRGVTDLMVMPGLINLDFADIRAVMSEMGKAMMGSGEAEGQNRSIEAAQRAISNPLLEDSSIAGARGLLINITGGPDLTLFEVDEAANRVRDEVDPDANIIFGSAFDETLKAASASRSSPPASRARWSRRPRARRPASASRAPRRCARRSSRPSPCSSARPRPRRSRSPVRRAPNRPAPNRCAPARDGAGRCADPAPLAARFSGSAAAPGRPRRAGV
jgi:cell division protein FtsZ